MAKPSHRRVPHVPAETQQIVSAALHTNRTRASASEKPRPYPAAASRGAGRLTGIAPAKLEIAWLQGVGSSGDGWTTGTLALPAAEVGGKNIKVEFRFVSDAGSTQETDVFGGFYIDDVLLVLE